MPGPLPLATRGQILGLHQNGVTSTEIATQLNIDRSTVYNIVRRYNEEGNVEPFIHHGRPRVTDEEQDERILEQFLENGFQSRRQIIQNLNVDCSLSTVRRRLIENGIRCHRPLKKIPLSVHHKEQRIAFALEHMGWQGEWENTIFSDEKVFSTDESGKVVLWRTRGTRCDERNVRFREHSGRITLAFWGCMSSRGPGPLVRTTAHMNSEEYMNILADVMIPYVRETFPDVPQVNFVQDNSAVHKARIVRDWLAAQPNLTTLAWPAKSPDLNVIENLWGIMVQDWDPRIRRSREVLAQYVVDKWEGLRAKPELFGNLIASMPQRLNAVIENNGSITRY